MSKQDLLIIMGEPLEKHENNNLETWYYSRPKKKGLFGNTDWRPRGVEIKDNKITQIIWWTNID